jgi:sugar phosphate isomerase/epimerase
LPQIAVIGLRIAVQTRSLAQPFKQALHTARAVQADGVQIDAREELRPPELSDTGARQLRKLLDDLNLRVGSVTFASRRGYAEANGLDRRLDATIDAMRMASRLAAQTLVLAVGSLPEPEARERSTLVEALTALAGHGSRWGVLLAAQCSTAVPGEVNALLAQLPEGLVGVDLNPADVIRAGGRPADFASGLGRHITHLYANDAVRGFGGAAAIEAPLGRGSADMPQLLAALEEFDYRGWATVERRNSPRPADECGDAIAYLRAL